MNAGNLVVRPLILLVYCLEVLETQDEQVELVWEVAL